MPSTPTIRLARSHEGLVIARLSRDRIEQGLAWSWTPQRVRRSMQDQDTNVAVMVLEGLVLGFGIMKYSVDEAHLLLLAVRPGVERRRIGTALVNWLESSARVAGIDRVMLEARASNAGARAFYRKQGYAEIEVVPRYYQSVEASVRLAKDLLLHQPASA